MWRAEAGQGRHDHHPAIVRHGRRQLRRFRRRLQDAKSIAHPLDQAACHEDGAFQGIMPHVIFLEQDGAEQSVRGCGHRRAAVGQDERARAEGGLGFTRRQPRLPDRGGLLIAGHAADRQGHAEQAWLGLGIATIAVHDCRQGGFGHAEEIEHLRIPVLPVQRHQRCATGIGGIADVQSTGQLVA